MKLNNFAFIVTFIALFASAGTASAQWYFGPRAGLSLMSISTDQDVTTSSLLGFHGGVTVRKQLSKQINVQADVLYSQMGGHSLAQLDMAPILMEIETNTYFTYVQVPIYANIEFPIKPKKLVPYFVNETWSSFHLYGGGFFGYALSAEQEVTTSIYSDGALTSKETTPKAEIADTMYNPIDFGIMAGLGFSFKLDKDDRQRLSIDLRYLLGLANTSEAEAVTTTNNALQISLAYTWKLTKRKHIRYAR